MLTSLANQVAFSSGVSQTFTYSPYSLQTVMIHTEDSSGAGAWAGTVTVQVGSRTICNGADIYGLLGLTTLITGAYQDNSNATMILNFGSHQMLNNDNVYVTIKMNQDVTGIDVSLVVDEPGTLNPLSITEYSDNTFTSNNVLTALSFDSAEAVVDDDNFACEVKTAIYSSAPTFTSANTYYRYKTLTNSKNDYYGILCENAMPLNTTFNYSASAVTDRILVVSAMPRSQGAVRKAKRSGQIAFASVSPSVR